MSHTHKCSNRSELDLFFVNGEDTPYIAGVGETKLDAVRHAMRVVNFTMEEFQTLMREGRVVIPRYGDEFSISTERV